MSAEKLNVTEHLRMRAENMLTQADANFQPGDIDDINKLHHELAVHQAELELQNEELRHAQLSLQKVRDRYVELYEQAPVGYVLLDAVGIIRHTNATWRAMLKRPDDDFRGTPFAETLVAGDARIFLSRFRSLFHNPADKQIELQIKRHQAKPFHAHITAKRSISEGTENDTNELMIVVSDISERRQAERLLNQQKTQLEQQNKALKQFNYAVSHELKTPLVSIESSLGLIQSTQSQTMDPELTQAIGYARHAARQMHHLLESLLLMFRMDAAESDAGTTTFGVLVQDAVDQLSRGGKLQDITVSIAAAELDLCGARGKLAQIWLQLIDNAAKFMGDQKHPAIDIGIEQMNPEVLFYVRDNGMGVNQPYQGKIFGLFDQLDKTVGGTGLGLTLVQRIVDYYGGTVRVDSAGKGAGSCFYFTLPGALIHRDTTT